MKLDVPNYDILRMFELMNEGQVNLYFCQGFNPLLAFPNRGKVTAGLAKLKLLVTIDPLDTETARFWENHGAYNDVDTAAIETEVIQLPSSCFAEDEGSLVNSGRWLQWHWPGQKPPGEAQARHLDHGPDLRAGARALPAGGRHSFPSRSSTSRGTTPTRATRRRRSWRGS